MFITIIPHYLQPSSNFCHLNCLSFSFCQIAEIKLHMPKKNLKEMSKRVLCLQMDISCQKWLFIFGLFVLFVHLISIEQNFKGDLLHRMHWTSFDLDYFFIQLKVVFSCTEWRKKRKIIFAKFFEIQGQGQSYNSRVQCINSK